MEIYVLTAEHGTDPGRILELFATKQAADSRAAEIVNIFLTDCELEATASASNWETALTQHISENDDLDADWEDAYVRIEAATLQGAMPFGPLRRATAETVCRNAGWTQGGDHAGVIYHARRFGSWKETVSYASDGDETVPMPGEAPSRIYETWAACAEGEGLLESSL